jgi:uncharacterized protein (UPF0335 family)
MLLQNLFESQRPVNTNISFEDSAEKVIATLKSYNSAEYTRLANRVEEVSRLEAEIKQIKEEVKGMVREHVAALFAADDAAKTRVVDTVSFIMTMSKDPKATESYQYAKVLEELTNHLTPELITVLSEIKSRFKTITQKEPSLKIARKEKPELDEGFLSAFRAHYGKFLRTIMDWGKKYDSKLENLKQQLA